MRDLLFKNLTSPDKKRRIIVSAEIRDNKGVRSIIRRNFIYLIKEIIPDRKGHQLQQALPYLYILKEENSKEQKKKFFCRIKGSMYAVNEDRLFLILFRHSLKISLISLKPTLGQCS